MSGKTFVSVMHGVSEKIQKEEFKIRNRKSQKDFTRERKAGMFETFMLVLRSSKKGMRKAIESFMEATSAEYQSYSKAAFCKARQKIKPEAFIEIMKYTAEQFYEEGPVKTLKGYRIFAIDGSDLNLPNTEELMKEYGSQPYNHAPQVQAMLSMMYDALNHIVLDVRIGKALGNERKLALEHIKEYDKYKGEKAIITADRGYPSEELIQALEKQGANYVLRTNKKEFWREVRDAEPKEDTCIVRKCKDGQVLKVRIIRVKLSDKTEETLLTNMFDTNLDAEFFKEVYRLRWKIESNYNLLKNQMQLENFSSVLPDCILQDIYAQMILLNLAAGLEADCNSDVEKINHSGKRKYPVAVNRAVCLSELKDWVIELFWASPRKQKQIQKHIRSVMMNNLSEIRDGRSFPREIKHCALKFHINYLTI